MFGSSFSVYPTKNKGLLYKKCHAGIFFCHTWYVFKQWNAAKNPTLSTSQNLYWNCIPFQSTAPPWNLHLPSGADFKFGKGTSGGTESQNGFCFSNLNPTLQPSKNMQTYTHTSITKPHHLTHPMLSAPSHFPPTCNNICANSLEIWNFRSFSSFWGTWTNRGTLSYPLWTGSSR